MVSKKIDITKPWPSHEHVATSGIYGSWSGKRVGTRLYYESDWRQNVGAKGFRLRPIYKRYLAAQKKTPVFIEAVGIKAVLL